MGLAFSRSRDKSQTAPEHYLEDESPVDTNMWREIAEARSYPELNHVHTSGFSDGENAISGLIYEAASMGVPYLGFTDHATVGEEGDPPGFYGEGEFQDPESLRMAVEENLRTEHVDEFVGDTFDMYLGCGMEMDYNPEFEEEIRHFIDESDPDYVLLSVHHDREGTNFKTGYNFTNEGARRAKLDEYFNLNKQAAEFADSVPEIKAIAHFDRIENNPVFYENISPERFEDHYKDFLDEIEGYDVLPEVNGKTRVRSIEYKGHPTIGSEVLIDSDTAKSGGTDTHRVGSSSKVDYKVGESERRLMELEEVAEQTDNMETILTELDLPSMSIPANDIDRRFWHS